MYRYTQTLIKKYWNRYVHFRSADPSSSGHFQCQKDINYGPSKQLLFSGTKKLSSLVPVCSTTYDRWAWSVLDIKIQCSATQTN